jgi:homospermidine synthase
MAKQALLNVAADIGLNRPIPQTRQEWATLMRDAGIKGIHVAERDTQRSASPKHIGTFANTWSVDGFLSEATQPAELGWGTHEKWRPPNAHDQKTGSKCAIYLMQPGGETKVRSWTPTAKAQFGFLLAHTESVTMADYFTVYDEDGNVTFRPTVHYAYHPCDDTVLSMHEMFGQAGKWQEKAHILDETEIVDGIDELGVLLYGHEKNAVRNIINWLISQLTNLSTVLVWISIINTRCTPSCAIPECHRSSSHVRSSHWYSMGT